MNEDIIVDCKKLAGITGCHEWLGTRCYVKVLYSFRRSFIADNGFGNAALIYRAICVHACTNSRAHVHAYAYIYLYTHIYLCVFIFIYKYIYLLISDPNYRVKYRLILKNTHVYIQLQHTPGRQESWSSETLIMLF